MICEPGRESNSKTKVISIKLQTDFEKDWLLEFLRDFGELDKWNGKRKVFVKIKGTPGVGPRSLSSIEFKIEKQ